MKQRILIYSFFIAAIIGVHAVGTHVAAQKPTEMVGGYSDISVKSKDARRSAAFAVMTRSHKTGKTITLVKINKAEQQVVAGMNYRICMLVREGRRKAYTVTAVVYQPIRKSRRLTNWKTGKCTDL